MSSKFPPTVFKYRINDAFYNIAADPTQHKDLMSEKFPDIVEKRPETTALYYNNSAVTPLFKPPEPKSRKLRRKTACAGLERLRRGRNAAVEGFIVKV